MPDTILEVKNLKACFHLDEGQLRAVDGVSFAIQREETLGVIGESGCGKSVTALSILRLLMPPGKIEGGEILYYSDDNQVTDLAKLHPNGEQIRKIRGKEIAMIFQEPMASLSPVHTIGAQMMEFILLHNPGMKKNEAQEIALDMLNKVGVSNPALRLQNYPHQLSGGMCQRVMIATALSCNPRLLICDEPTTALDVTVQAQIIDLMEELQAEMGMSMLYITHDLGVIAEVADDVAVMYLGKIVEKCDVKTIFKKPMHPYTQRLMQSVPKLSSLRICFSSLSSRRDVLQRNMLKPLSLRAVSTLLASSGKNGLLMEGMTKPTVLVRLRLATLLGL
jgi:peptide/nickel transport system ATP-binding protein